MHVIERLTERLKRDDGYTMIAVVGAIAVVTSLVGVALAATNGDLRAGAPRSRRQARLRGGPGRPRPTTATTSTTTRATGRAAPTCRRPTPSTSRARPSQEHPPRRPRLDRRTPRITARADPGHRAERVQHQRPGRQHARARSGSNIGTLQDPLDRLSRATRSSPSSRPSSRRASSTTSTSPSSRPRTRSATASRTPRPRSPAPTRSAASSAARAA